MTSPQPIPETPQPESSDSRGWAVAAHLVTFVGLGLIGPLVIWLIKREEDPFVEEHAREALNFQLSMLIYTIGLALTIIGILALIPLWIFALVVTIIAAIKAANGEGYHYPLSISLVNP